MEKEKLEALLIEYIDGQLSKEDKELIEKEIKESAEAQKLYDELKEIMQIMDRSEPMEQQAGHDLVFRQQLEQEMTRTQRFSFSAPVVYRMAAGIALLMIGIAGGYWLSSGNQQDERLAELQKEMAATKQMMMSMLTNDQSASQRMQGVNVALTISQADDDIVKALAHALVTDPNTNVRLAALEALEKFVEEEGVRKILISSLSKQNDPVVQIALIQLMVRMKEKQVVNDLEKIIEDDNSIQAVKDEAYTGILKLS